MIAILGSLAERHPPFASYGERSHDSPWQPPHPHPQLHQVRPRLRQLLLRRRKLARNVQVRMLLTQNHGQQISAILFAQSLTGVFLGPNF